MIYTDEKVLRQPCSDANSEEIGAIIAKLEYELNYSNMMGRPGIGLSAPQIGIHKNVAIIRIDNNHNLNLINCKIQNKYDQFKFSNEGCLSFPNLIRDSIRYNEIHLIDNLMYPYACVLTGLMAVVAQHEIDHWNNRLLPDFGIEPPKQHKIRPNELCHCGSNIKFKKCHGK